MVWVVAGRVEDGDADQAARVDCTQQISNCISTQPYASMSLGWCWRREHEPLGCQMSTRNFMLGGASG